VDGYRRGTRGGYWHHRCPEPQPRPTVPSPPACRPLEIIEYPVTLSARWANVVEAARRGRGSTPSAVVRCHRASETIVAGEWSGPSALADPDPISVHPDAVDPHVGGRSRPGLCWLVVDDPTKRPKRHYFHWRPGFHPGREMPQKQPITTMECKAADPTQSHRDPQLEGRVPPRPDRNDSTQGPVSPGPRDAVEGVPLADAVERIPPSAPGASELAKRMECASLLALSDHRTASGDLAPHSCLPQATGWVAQPMTLPIRGPDSPLPVSRSSSEPPDCLHCRDPKRRLRSCAGIKCAPAATAHFSF